MNGTGACPASSACSRAIQKKPSRLQHEADGHQACLDPVGVGAGEQAMKIGMPSTRRSAGWSGGSSFCGRYLQERSAELSKNMRASGLRGLKVRSRASGSIGGGSATPPDERTDEQRTHDERRRRRARQLVVAVNDA
jgi:hypothetical protein